MSGERTKTDIRGEELKGLLKRAREANSPHVDLGPVLGLDEPLRFGVSDLHSAVLAAAQGRPELPRLSLCWDGGSLTVEHLQGGALARLKVVF
jgi:hypothetical protein